MEKPTEAQRIALDALNNAGELYRRYLAVAEVADLPDVAEEQPAADLGVRSWSHPLGIHIIPAE